MRTVRVYANTAQHTDYIWAVEVYTHFYVSYRQNVRSSIIYCVIAFIELYLCCAYALCFKTKPSKPRVMAKQRQKSGLDFTGGY